MVKVTHHSYDLDHWITSNGRDLLQHPSITVRKPILVTSIGENKKIGKTMKSEYFKTETYQYLIHIGDRYSTNTRG
jgi:hypothetical protein